jgi:hypothetical protein
LKLENGVLNWALAVLIFLKIEAFEIGQAVGLGSIRRWKVGNRRNNGLETTKF